MIRGVGIDLIEVARIRSAAERFGDRFLNRILRPAELAYCRTFRDPAPHLAARFAAKEAVSKAFGTGITAALGWQDMEVANHENGQPYLILHGGGSRLLAQGGGGQIHLSLSHTENYGTAVAVWDQP
jgi:holo-[acyl-carrier protein] synthase